MDHQLPPALARWVADQAGVIGAFHVADRGMTEAVDADIWRLCAEQGWILVSKDRDFADLYARRVAPDTTRPRVLWCGSASAAGCNCWPLSTGLGRQS